jgi:hypothetical protein
MKKTPNPTTFSKLADKRALLEKRIFQALQLGMDYAVVAQLQLALEMVNIEIYDDVEASKFKDAKPDGVDLDIE